MSQKCPDCGNHLEKINGVYLCPECDIEEPMNKCLETEHWEKGNDNSQEKH